MVSAFVLVNCHFPYSDGVFEQLNKLSSISSIYRTMGIYDMMVRITSATEESLTKAISKDIRAIDHVNGTITMIIADK